MPKALLSRFGKHVTKCFIFVALTLLLLELGAAILLKLHILKNASSDDISRLIQSIAPPTTDMEPGLIPHPYFGYIYTPSHKFPESGVQIQSNSEGFVDDEFPPMKRADLTVVGIVGGSAAMSWGVEKPEHRINSYLERKLNDYSKDKGLGKSFRVLNLGVVGHMAYQASQIFGYFADRLDAVIMYTGNNEISWGILLQTPNPLRFPQIDVYGLLLGFDGVAKKIVKLRQYCRWLEKTYQRHPVLLKSKVIRYCTMLYLRRLKHWIYDLNRGIPNKSLRAQDWVVFDPGRSGMPKFDYFRHHFSTLPTDLPYRLSIFERVLPMVSTNPIGSSYSIAKFHGIEFVWVIQPLLGSIKKVLSEKEKAIATSVPVVGGLAKNATSVQYQIDGVRMLRKEAVKLKAKGVEVLDLNSEAAFRDYDGKDIFRDNMHLNPDGNRVVAEALFNYIKGEWNVLAPVRGR